MLNIPDSENLIKKAFWLCSIRWYAAIGVVVATSITAFVIDLQINFTALYVLSALLLMSNVFYIQFLRSIKNRRDEKCILRVRNHLHIQIIKDLLFLTMLLHFSGGIENPFIIFYIFHMIISSILLGKKCTYFLTSVGIFLFASLAITEYLGIVPHLSINKYISSLIENDPVYLFAALVIFAITSYLVVFITSTLSGRLRKVEQKLKVANMNLIEKDQIKNEYVKRLTHDIKGHIAAIQANIELVHKQLIAPVDPANQEFVEQAYNRTLQLSEFIKELLALTNMRLNKKFDRETIDIRQMLESSINSAIECAKRKKITFTQDINIVNPSFLGIKSSISEVASNLFQNAMKYTPEGGTVHVQATSDTTAFKLVVTDNGSGIPKEDLPHIFEEFYRASNAKSSNIEGTGLGLSLVKAIVDRHKGTIKAKSTLGVGTTFTVVLPHN